MSIALAPATTLRTPSAKIACARMVDVLVPSPDNVAGLLGRLAQHLRAEVLLGILEVEFLGDGHAVVADDRRAPFLLDQHRFRFRPQRDADGIGELRRPTKDLLPGGGTKHNLFVRHRRLLLSMTLINIRKRPARGL